MSLRKSMELWVLKWVEKEANCHSGRSLILMILELALQIFPCQQGKFLMDSKEKVSVSVVYVYFYCIIWGYETGFLSLFLLYL